MPFSQMYSDMEVLVQPGDIITVEIVDVGCEECNTRIPEATARVRYTGLYQIRVEANQLEIRFEMLTSDPIICGNASHQHNVWLIAPFRGVDIPLVGLNQNRIEGLPYLDYAGSEKPGLN